MQGCSEHCYALYNLAGFYISMASVHVLLAASREAVVYV